MKNNFSKDFIIRIGEINYIGHMGYDRTLMIFHDARISFFDSLGFSETNIGKETGIIINEAFIKFKKEVFLNDKLKVFISISDIKETSFLMNYSVFRPEDESEVFTGYTKIYAFNYKDKAIVKIPEDFLDKIKLHEII